MCTVTLVLFNVILGSSLYILCIESWPNAWKRVKARILALPYMLKRKHTCSHVRVPPSTPSLLTWLPGAVSCASSFGGQQLDCHVHVPFVSACVWMLRISCIPWKWRDVLFKGSPCSWPLSKSPASLSGWSWRETLCSDTSGFVLLFQCVKHALEGSYNTKKSVIYHLLY